MKKTIQTLVAGLLAANCLIAYGETETVSGQGCMTNELIRFNHIVADEAAAAAMGFKGTNGKISAFERINAIYVTDSQENINRMREILKEIDVPSPVLEEVFDCQIKYAKATDIKTHLEKIVTESQKENQKEDAVPKTNMVPGFAKSIPPQRPTSPLRCINRPGLNKPEPTPNISNAVFAVSISDAGRSMIRGKVLIVADERSNKLIIITQKENMDFFDKVIKSLDVKMTPEMSMNVKPSQVQLETVIVEVELDGDIQTGTDWIERGRQKFFDGNRLNIAAIVQAAKDDSRAKILYTPTLTTCDNMCTEIAATETIYLLGSCHRSNAINSEEWVRNYEKRDIGLTMKVRPRVNPNGTVTLILEGSYKTRGADQNVPNESGGTAPYATISECKRSCDMMAEDNQTIMMGGLTKKTNVQSESGVPLLKDIPWIGKPLFGSTLTKEIRSELLVFITPHVLDNPNNASH